MADENKEEGTAGSGDTETETETGGDTETVTKTAAKDADDAEKGPDSMSPEAIARRVAALDEDDAVERYAREQERKLAERTKGTTKKKSGLEVAASKKLAKIGERAQPQRSVAVAADADPLIERTIKLSDWAKQNQKIVQIVGAVLAVGLLGFAGFMYHEHQKETEASLLLTQAVEAQTAPIGEPPKDDEADDQFGPMFKTYEDREKAALAQYREVESKYPDTAAATLARLAEGALLLDKHEADAALAAFQAVKTSRLAEPDKEVRCRALEGIGFALEQKAHADGADKNKFLDDALKTYQELDGTNVPGFKELGMFHQGRVLLDKGDKDKAKEILVQLKDRLDKPDEGASAVPRVPSFPYLKAATLDRLREIDPALAPKESPDQQKFSPEIQRLIQQMQQQKGGGAP